MVARPFQTLQVLDTTPACLAEAPDRTGAGDYAALRGGARKLPEKSHGCDPPEARATGARAWLQVSTRASATASACAGTVLSCAHESELRFRMDHEPALAFHVELSRSGADGRDVSGAPWAATQRPHPDASPLARVVQQLSEIRKRAFVAPSPNAGHHPRGACAGVNEARLPSAAPPSESRPFHVEHERPRDSGVARGPGLDARPACGLPQLRGCARFF